MKEEGWVSELGSYVNRRWAWALILYPIVPPTVIISRTVSGDVSTKKEEEEDVTFHYWL